MRETILKELLEENKDGIDAKIIDEKLEEYYFPIPKVRDIFPDVLYSELLDQKDLEEILPDLLKFVE